MASVRKYRIKTEYSGIIVGCHCSLFYLYMNGNAECLIYAASTYRSKGSFYDE